MFPFGYQVLGEHAMLVDHHELGALGKGRDGNGETGNRQHRHDNKVSQLQHWISPLGLELR